MPVLWLLLAIAAAGGLPPVAPLARSVCSDDYVTIETVRGEILEIKPNPEPFPTADILFSGPPQCRHVWMQVMKSDAQQCRKGQTIVATGVVTADPERAESWNIESPRNGHMVLGDDFSCALSLAPGLPERAPPKYLDGGSLNSSQGGVS